MWSDRPTPRRLSHLRDRLRRLLPRRSSRRRQGQRLRLDASAVELAARLCRSPGFVWLDDSTADRHLIAFAPALRAEVSGRRCNVTSANGRARFAAGGFELLEALHTLGDGAADEARLYGHLGYELAAELELLPAFPPADVPLPDLAVGLHDVWLYGEGGRWWLRGPACWRRASDVEGLLHRLERPPAAALAGAPAVLAGLRSRPTPAGYRAAVARTVARIHDGEIFETNLCRRFEMGLPLREAWPLYLRMRDTGAARYGAFLRTSRAAVLSRSPECFLRVRNRSVESLPIKGTRPRHVDADADAWQLESLRTAEKDAAELAMIVDLVRNDLGRVCRAGSVEVAEHRAVMQLSTVWHTYSRITGRLRDDVGPTALLRASFPPGSITGAPKIQAMTVAVDEEPHRRGAAMGAIGWIALGGDMELSVAIRTATVGGGNVVYHAGCGIVADSDPQSELDETEAKARVFLRALELEGHARVSGR